MKRFSKHIFLMLLLLLLVGLFSACGKTAQEVQDEFTKIIQEKATPERLLEASDFLDRYGRKLSLEGSSHLVVAFEDYLLQYANTDHDEIQLQGLFPYMEEKSGKLDEKKLNNKETKRYYQDLVKGFLYPVSNGTRVELRIDYRKLGKEYKKIIDPALYDLYEIDATLTEIPVVQDATLKISYQQLLERTNSIEALMEKYPGNKLISEDAQWLYSTYLNMVLMGTTNSPAFDYATGEFNNEAKKAYRDFMPKNEDATLTWALMEYFRYLNSVNYTIDYKDSVMSKAFFDSCDLIKSEAEKRVFQ